MKPLNFYFLTLVTLAIFGQSAFSQTVLATVEAENATLNGVTTTTATPGYSGSAYVYMAGSGDLTFTVNASKSGFYQLTIRALTSMGAKSQDLYLNTVLLSTLAFPGNNSFFDFNAGNLRLNAGVNTIKIAASWGYMYFDKFTLTSVAPHDYTQTTSALINANANAKTNEVYAYLRANYGKNIISGQTAYWNELIALVGKTPVVRAFEFQHYTVGYPYLWSNQINGQVFGWEDDGTTQAAINWYNSTGGKGIVTFQWHWHSPSGGTVGTNTFYSNSTTFDASKAVQSNTAENTAVLRDIDSIATQLKRLQAAGVPVLWRPLHEAGGAWFWWGAKGATACLQLYDIVYDRLTNYHALNNLIWVWSTPEANWYPGNAKVDLIGYDSYPAAYNYTTQKSVFDQLFALVQGQKIVTMSENGPIPDIDNCIADDAMWCYFSSWVDMVASNNTTPHVVAVYNHAQVITLDEVITSISNVNVEGKALRVFPNPAAANAQLSVSFDAAISGIDVYDALGHSEHFCSPVFTTTLSGLLLVRVHSSEGEKVLKVFVE